MPQRDNTIVYIGAVVAIILFFLGGIVYLIALGREVTQIVALMSLIGAPTVVALLNLLQSKRNGDHLDVVRRQTNGKMTELQQQVDDLKKDKED